MCKPFYDEVYVISDFEVVEFLGGGELMTSRNPNECARWLLPLFRHKAQKRSGVVEKEAEKVLV